MKILNLASSWNSSKIVEMVRFLNSGSLFGRHIRGIVRYGLVFMLALWAGTVFAQTASSPCDADYYESLKSRAWLEAQREITQNQNLIFKPDSVFEYTCFDLFLSELADHAKDMFSETQRWGLIPGVDQFSMDRALNNLVGQSLLAYINQNFENTPKPPPPTYDLLGGRLKGVDHDFPLTIQPYNCSIMNQVWMAAKCMNFIEDQQHDGFYTFEEYRDGKDKRFLPSECTNPKARWRAEIYSATVNGDPPTGTPWKEDLVTLFFDKLSPVNCASSTPVPTGVVVYRPSDSPTQFNEGVCVPSGCYAVPTAKDNGAIGLTCRKAV